MWSASGGVLIVALALVAAGCSDDDNRLKPPPPSGLPSMTVDELLASPDTLRAGGMMLSAELYLGRDFMPVAPPEGWPLVAFALLNGSPPGNFPPSVSDVYVWVIRDSSEVWGATMSFQGIDPSRNGAHSYYAAEGPLWGPGILVDVVIGVRTSPTEVSLALFRDVRIIMVQ